MNRAAYRNTAADLMTALIVGFCALFVLLFIASIVRDVEHRKFLREHGCQLLTKAPTGRWIQTGKVGHDEHVYVYECIDGTRTEVH